MHRQCKKLESICGAIHDIINTKHIEISAGVLILCFHNIHKIISYESGCVAMGGCTSGIGDIKSYIFLGVTVICKLDCNNIVLYLANIVKDFVVVV